MHGLYLGSYNDARDTWQLGSNGVTHIMSVHENAKPDMTVNKLTLLYTRHDSL